MKRIVITLAILLIILAGAISFLYLNSFNQNPTGAIIANKYSYTKAICDESNYCQDYVIICEDNKTISINPITGATIQHLPDWQDPRDKETIERLC
jgi:cytochrome bd-type quinol oxidase subunit 1|tara:strand:+ start:115 stop:402 length:288 start_codon:yes stop_codon:yes gene_type:complete